MDIEPLRLALREPKFVAHRLYTAFYRTALGNGGVDVMERDWDNLLILDACRYDLFSETCDIDGELTDVVSPGSHTVEFLQKTFQGCQYNDTVYVSATPQLEWVGLSDAFHDVVPVWEDGWDDELGTVPPTAVCDAAREAATEYPHKRLIVHFVQPHFPFIGPAGESLGDEMSIRSGIDGGDESIQTVWDCLESGLISEAAVWKAYRENLEIVLRDVAGLLDDLDGKTVLTSDHGNAFGEYGLYGHAGRKAIKELIQVPWLEIESEERRRIVSQSSTRERAETNKAELEQRLSDLGYR